MPLPFEVARFDALKQLAAERFGRIEFAEAEVLRLSASTEELSTHEREDRPVVRAAFLRWLATDKEAAAHIDSRGLRVADATITSAIELGFCGVAFPLRFARCTFRDKLHLNSAELPTLDLLDCEAEHGIFADALRTHGPVYLRKLKAKGELRFVRAQISGDLDSSGAHLAVEGNALIADRAKIAGGVFLNKGFSSSGTIRFLGAQISGNLDCSGAALSARGSALIADRAQISGGVYLREGFCSSGETRFLGARIGGNLDCSGATLTTSGCALDAYGAKIAGNVFLRGKFSSTGQVCFEGAQIGGSLHCAGATLTAIGDAFSAEMANVTGGVLLTESFSCFGTMRFQHAQIVGDLDCSGARIRVLTCEHMRLEGSLIWTRIREPKAAHLNLLGASVDVFRDDTESWPAPGGLAVNGLEYGDLFSHETSTQQDIAANHMAAQRPLRAEERIRWLNLQRKRNRVDPHAWMWLAKLFKEKDDIAGYRKVLREYRLMKARSHKNLVVRLFEVRMAHLEMNPWLILSLFLPLLMLGTAVYWHAALDGQMPPTSTEAYNAWAAGTPLPIAYPRFNALIYTLENELPLVKFGMDDKWGPDPNLAVRRKFWAYWFLAGFRWFLILAGWVQGVLLTLGVTRRFRE